MNRRNAFKAMLAGLAWPFVPRTTAAKLDDFTITVPVNMDTKGVREAIRDLESPPIQGVLGETYFCVGAEPSLNRSRFHRCYLDGVDVTCRAREADAVGGWARMYDVDAKGKNIITRMRTHYGRVEFR